MNDLHRDYKKWNYIETGRCSSSGGDSGCSGCRGAILEPRGEGVDEAPDVQ